MATPYDVLSRFVESVDDADVAEDLPGRMSRLLAQGTGAQWAQVWLPGLRPADAGRSLAGRATPRPLSGPDGPRTLPVRYGDEAAGRCSGSRNGPACR